MGASSMLILMRIVPELEQDHERSLGLAAAPTLIKKHRNKAQINFVPERVKKLFQSLKNAVADLFNRADAGN